MRKIKVNKFSAEWCGPCKVMGKTFDKVKELPEFNDVEFNEYDVDDDSSADLVQKFQIRNIPAIIICDENNEQLGKIVGVVNESLLVQAINDNRNNE